MGSRERSHSRVKSEDRNHHEENNHDSREIKDIGREKDRSDDERRDRKNDRKRSRSRSRGGSRSRYRSRSRSRSRSPRRRSRRSRSRSRGRSYSHSPMSVRRRHAGSRDNPPPSRCLGVFGLSVYTTEQELNHIFSKYGPLERVQVVIDAKSGRSRGFAFVYFEALEDAKIAKEQCSGMEFDGRRIRVDYSITQRAHTPTPGIYMGRPSYSSRDRDYGRWDDRRSDDYYRSSYRNSGYRRSPSPYYRSSHRSGRRYERSRSRSYSPRHYRSRY